jgi:hypothetical protein
MLIRTDWNKIGSVNIKSRFFRIADPDIWRPNSTLISQTWTARAIIEEFMGMCYKAKMFIRYNLFKIVSFLI